VTPFELIVVLVIPARSFCRPGGRSARDLAWFRQRFDAKPPMRLTQFI
jgi:hypothetical protein